MSRFNVSQACLKSRKSAAGIEASSKHEGGSGEACSGCSTCWALQSSLTPTIGVSIVLAANEIDDEFGDDIVGDMKTDTQPGEVRAATTYNTAMHTNRMCKIVATTLECLPLASIAQ